MIKNKISMDKRIDCFILFTST